VNLVRLLRKWLNGRDGFFVEIQTTHRVEKFSFELINGRGSVQFKIKSGEMLTRTPRLELWQRGSLLHSKPLEIETGIEFINRPIDPAVTDFFIGFDVEFK